MLLGNWLAGNPRAPWFQRQMQPQYIEVDSLLKYSTPYFLPPPSQPPLRRLTVCSWWHDFRIFFPQAQLQRNRVTPFTSLITHCRHIQRSYPLLVAGGSSFSTWYPHHSLSLWSPGLSAVNSREETANSALHGSQPLCFYGSFSKTMAQPRSLKLVGLRTLEPRQAEDKRMITPCTLKAKSTLKTTTFRKTSKTKTQLLMNKLHKQHSATILLELPHT